VSEAATGAGRGVAGRTGDDVRSDLLAEVELTEGGGLVVEVASKVGAMYGAAIEAETRRVCAALGVADARIRLDDRGALDPVIGARVEAALRRAGVSGGDGRPPRSVTLTEPTARDRLRRSRLYLPGDQPKLAINAGLHRPDGVILDLEDSVHPDHKDAARLVVRNLLRTVDFLGASGWSASTPSRSGLRTWTPSCPRRPT
jgi:citrate lyase subunit beta / citryl-CoA lyase